MHLLSLGELNRNSIEALLSAEETGSDGFRRTVALLDYLPLGPEGLRPPGQVVDAELAHEPGEGGSQERESTQREGGRQDPSLGDHPDNCKGREKQIQWAEPPGPGDDSQDTYPKEMP